MLLENVRCDVSVFLQRHNHYLGANDHGIKYPVMRPTFFGLKGQISRGKSDERKGAASRDKLITFFFSLYPVRLFFLSLLERKINILRLLRVYLIIIELGVG